MLTPRFALLPLAFLLFVTGCRIETHKNGAGKDNVDIGTPFGSMHVKTDDKAEGAQTGITPYPGATLVKKDKDDGGAANISMSFGGFQMGVHAVELTTNDAEDKVLAFYRDDLKRYGDVLTCRGKQAVGMPARTREGLTCNDSGSHVDAHDGDADHLELRAGSEHHQHIVGVHRQDDSTRIGLVALDLPSGFRHREASERE